MRMQEDYDVLRLIGHNRICHVSSDNVRGCTLAEWIKHHPIISKTQLMNWSYDIICQLEQIHKCRGNPSYQYVNPYSVIISEEGKLCFLDASADSNKERIRLMQISEIKKYFLPEEKIRNLNMQEELDIYGAGKTVQYLLAFTEIKPRLTRKEVRKLKKMIIRCIDRNHRRAFQKMTEVKSYVSGIKNT